MICASAVRLAQTASTPVTEAEILNILSVADFKTEHRIRHSVEDTKIEEAIKEAYYRLDGPKGWLNRAVLTQIWVGVIDGFDDYIEVPLPTLASVDQIRYRDADGDWNVLATTVYGVESYGLFARIYLKDSQTWPTVLTTEPGSVEITFTAGWGDGAAVLSAAYGMRKALKLLAGHYYFNPTPTFVEPRLVEVPRKVQYQLENVIGQFRIRSDPS